MFIFREVTQGEIAEASLQASSGEVAAFLRILPSHMQTIDLIGV